MKITVKNLGAVEQAEIDLKPLTVFVGHNGTGKTWTAYALASIFSPHGHGKYLESYITGNTQKKYLDLDKAIDDFLEEGSAVIDIVQFAKENMQAYFNDVACLAPSWMRSYLSTRRVDFDDLVVEIDFHGGEEELAKRIKSCYVDRDLSIFSKNINLYKEKGSKNLFFSMEESKNKAQKLNPVKRIKRFICGNVFKIIYENLFLSTYLFPTERTTFVTLPINNKGDGGNDKNEDNNESSNSLGFSNPVLTFDNMIAKAASVTLDNRADQVIDSPKIKKYMKLADILENKILGGKGDFEGLEIDKELLFSADENIKLEMNVVSSMVKELIPLVLYLRYLAQPNDLIVIDEPEMNLHPAAQVEIIEFLAMLVNAGLNVLITTHSPYIVDHISNLIAAHQHKHPEVITEHFYLQDKRAFIAQDKVSVQLFEDNTAKNILDVDGIINWETFWNVSADISGIYSQLLKTKG